MSDKINTNWECGYYLLPVDYTTSLETNYS